MKRGGYSYKKKSYKRSRASRGTKGTRRSRYRIPQSI